MSSRHPLDAPKKSANLGINSGLLNTAKELDINLSARRTGIMAALELLLLENR